MTGFHYCKCGRKYHGRVRCACGLEATHCVHRGDAVGNASCKCGTIYRCLVGQYCGDSVPVDDLVELQFNDGSPSQLIMFVDYQCCSQCPNFEPLPSESTCRVSQA